MLGVYASLPPKCITGSSAILCRAVGVAAPPHGPQTGLFLTSGDGGRTWHRTGIPPRDGVAEYGGIACPGPEVCYVTGFRGTVLITADGGRHWRSGTVDTQEDPGGLACASVQVCHVLGPSSAILSTTDGGYTWRDYTHGTKDNLVAVACPTTMDCRPLDPSGLLLVTDDGGKTWTSRPSPLPSTLGFPSPGLACPSALTCYIGGEKSTIYRTQDVGKTWQTLATPLSRTALPLSGISCPSATVCYAVGSGCLVADCYGPESRAVVLGSTDGGDTWRGLYDKRSGDLAHLGDAILQAIACPSVAVCYVAGSPGLVITTSDGGHTWNDQHSPASGSNTELSGIACPSTTACSAVGYGCQGGGPGCMLSDFVGVVLSTRDGGQSWSRYESTRTVRAAGQVCGSSGICRTGIGLNSITCTSTSDCRAVGGDGEILATHDNGRTWQAETSPTDNALLGIACPAPQACLAAGSGGTILGLGAGQPSDSHHTHARGDAWSCPPFAQGCGLFGSSWRERLHRTHYTAILTLDPHSHLPLSWTSWVVPPGGRPSSRQSIRFTYANPFTIALPHDPEWTCPWWDPPGTWCMKEPGA